MENQTTEKKIDWKILALGGLLILSLIGNIFTFGREFSKMEDMERNGGGMMKMTGEKNKNNEGMEEMMKEHCKSMPEMPGCTKINGMSDKTMGGMHTMDMSDPMSMSMADMGAMLEGQTGDALDKAFLEGMIPHHQGAIDMAKYLVNAKHPELKKMGEEIISAQQKEINQMNTWLKEWGYKKDSSSSTMSGDTLHIGAENPNSSDSDIVSSEMVDDESMREHCKMMPQMQGCEKFK